MGLPWLKKPFLLHSSRANGYNIAKMNAFEVALVSNPYLNWYNADYVYARGTAYFFCAGILLVSMYSLGSHLRMRYSRTNSIDSSSISLTDRAVALARYTTARQFRVKAYAYYSPPLVAILAVCGIFTFVCVLMLGPHPYYWPSDNLGHSPPIATRTGWISIAIMPFMMFVLFLLAAIRLTAATFSAFSMKVNLIGVITDTSHEKLQVFHRWTALIMYLTSLAHTYPFIIISIHHGQMELMWKTSPYYWTGVAALIPQTWLVAMSWGPLRNRYYETFKKLHFIAAGIFMVALFFHCYFRLTSWDYFIATGIIYALSYLRRIGKTVFNSGTGLDASIQQLPDDMVSISVDAPERLKWSAGQHVFIRFLSVGVHAFSSHPFTVTTLNLTQTPEGVIERNKVGAHSGITRRLYDLAAGKSYTTALALVDGPYGGISTSLKTFDKVCILAGGSGSTFAIPLLLELSRYSAAGFKCKFIEFILSVRHIDAIDWLKADIESARSLFKDGRVRLHVTRDDYIMQGDNLKSDVDSAKNDFEISSGRPDLPAVIRAATSSSKGRVAFIACGPDPFMYDVRNAVAESQLAIVDGFGPCREIFLHTESYSW